MKETFAIPAVGAIIVKKIENEEFILIQNRKKNNGDGLADVEKYNERNWGGNAYEYSLILCMDAVRKL